MKSEVIYRIKLPLFLRECPLWWKNFSNSVPDGEMDARLDEYKAKIYKVYSGEISNFYLEFDSSDDAIIFKLRWT